MSKQYFVYILASKKDGVLYTGFTSSIKKRIWEHRSSIVDSFSKKYFVKKLVYYEVYESPEEAILREKRIKKWNRSWKVKLIEKENVQWKDLYESL